ncbi:hypothetical protein [Arenibacter echinorum]|uniref:Outer membrane protein with beta-barrel domain n=1 Tax=Arenibacter echinorum TaxID=440515 RepID=A0A327R9R8_9FLAO|nr:hypothetical protein [Arenibacter echinorum]RAJ12364.1 hypothetical protein LV92_01597 [Arenibacter echinorum]
MKNIVFVLIFATIPTLTFAQFNDDGKSSNNSIKEKVGSEYKNALMYYSHIPFSPYGIKYSYCKSWGFYISATYDFETVDGDAFLNAGVVKSISKKTRCYIGSGYNPIWEEACVETGVTFVFGKFALDIGGGFNFIVPEYSYANLGTGFNF